LDRPARECGDRLHWRKITGRSLFSQFLFDAFGHGMQMFADRLRIGRFGDRQYFFQQVHHLLGGKDLSCDGLCAPAVDCRKAELMERPEGLPVLPKAWLGIMESAPHAREDL